MKRWMIVLIVLMLTGCAAVDLDAGPALAVDTGIDPESWALVPAGEFLRGQFDQEVMVEYDYEMMVTHVTNEQFARYLNEALAAGTIEIVDGMLVGYYPGDEFHGYEHEEEIAAGDWPHMPVAEPGMRLEFDGTSFSVVPGYENHPVVHVSWFGAQAYCQFYDWRLPTEIEWEKAARGTDGQPYPWGDDIEHENANFYASRDPFEELYGRQGNTTPVGFYNGMSYDGYQTIDSPSPYGLYDMAGNVEQWTGDVYENQHYRYLRGGSKQFYGFDLRVWVTNNVAPYYYSPSIGFRCVREP